MLYWHMSLIEACVFLFYVKGEKVKENQWEQQYDHLMEELQKLREMLEEEKRKSDEMYRMLMEDDWK